MVTGDNQAQNYLSMKLNTIHGAGENWVFLSLGSSVCVECFNGSNISRITLNTQSIFFLWELVIHVLVHG